MYWIDEGKLATQQAWVSEQMKLLAEAGRTFDERSVQTATAYDRPRLVGARRRRSPSVPRPRPPLRRCGVGGAGAAPTARRSKTWRRGWRVTSCPKRFDGSPVAIGAMFSPRPKEPWWPAAAPEVPGVGERVFVTFFVETDVREAFDPWFATLGDDLAATGRARALLVAPFIPTIPGTDTYIDQLW